MSSSANKTYLGDYVDFQNGYAFKSSDYTEKGHYLIRIKNVQQGFIEINDECFVKIPNETKFEKFKLKNGDIVISLTGNVGRIARIRDEHLPAVLNQRVASAAPKDNKVLEREYLYYLLRTPEFFNFAISSGKGAAQQNISTADLEKYEVRIPTPKKQREIVDKLDNAFAEFDLMEEALSLSISKSNELMQSLLSASLVSSEAELGSSNSSAKQVFDMKTFKLSEVCSFSRGLTYSKGDEVEYSSNVVLRANNIDLASNSLNLEDLRYIKESIRIKKEKIAKKDSIIICTASGSKSHVGKVALIDEDYGYAFGGFMGQITPLSNCHYKYLYYILTSGSFKEYLMTLNDGTNINNLKFSDIEDYEFSMPSLENQLKIVEKLDRAFIEIEFLKSQISVRQSFASVLQQSLLSSVFIKVDEVA